MDTTRRLSVCLFAAMALNTSGAPSTAAEPVRDVGYFLKRLRTLDHLPELEESHTGMSSTWDRTGGNIDGFDFKRVERDGRNILLDVDGPDCIHRIMAACQEHSKRKGFFEKQMGYGAAERLIRDKKSIWSSTAFWYADKPLPANSGEVLALPR